MALRRKKGSTLILVIIAVGLLSVLGTVVLSMSLADQKLRVQESNNTKNLYSSESGIEVAYGILEKVVKEAVENGDKAVEDLKDNVADINSQSVENRNKRFNEEFQNAYIKYVNDNLKNSIQNGDYSSAVVDGDTPKVKVTELDEVEDANDDKKFFDIKLTSSFTSTNANNQGNKTISVNYKFAIPEYSRTIKIADSGEIPQYNMLNNIISCDGDLNINNNGTVGFYGTIWAKGNVNKESEISNPIYDKYKGGIDISGSGSSSVYGEIITSGTFRANQDYGIILSGNAQEGKMYAGNFYVGKKNIVDSNINTNSKRVVDARDSSIYLNNDLCINYSKSTLTLGNFYGLNDKTTEPFAKQYKNSSSIIINAEDIGKKDGTSLTINKDAYIMGTAYINTSPDYYQTGESVAIKGNYKSYTSQINNNTYKSQKDNKTFDDAILEYKAPLQVVTKFKDGTAFELADKIDYFDLYNEENKSELKKSGIEFKGIENGTGTVKSIGAYINKGNVKKGSYTIQDEEDIRVKKKDFASKVFMMGSGAEVSDFENGEVKKTVENQIDWDKMTSIIKDKGNVIENIILNDNSSKDITIETINNKIEVKLGNTSLKTYDSIDTAPTFLVISKGNVKYNVNNSVHRLKCAVITAGNVNIDINGATASIGNYDTVATPVVTEAVNKMFNKYYSTIFKNIFNKDASANQSSSNRGETEYEEEKANAIKIVKERWKLEK